MFAGTYTALVTPFHNDSVDDEAFERLIEAQIKGGVEGIVPVGTTGESPTLDHPEHQRVIGLAAKYARGRCKVIAGTGSNATSEAVKLTKKAEKAGVDGALLVAPYYNKPSQEGLFRHFKKIADETGLPLVLYSIPGRCGVEIGVDTVQRLAEACSNIVAIKEAGGSVERVSALRQALPDTFKILSGDDSLTIPFMSVGAEGVISVAANIIPQQVGDMVRFALAGNYTEARRIHQRYYPLFRDLFVETNPVPIKHALARTGAINMEVRLPLCPLTDASAKKLEATLRKLKLIK